MTGYYDIVLGAIPLSFLSITGTLTVATDLSFTVAIVLGSLVALAFIGHAMFVNGPVDAMESTSPSTTDPTQATFQDAD